MRVEFRTFKALDVEGNTTKDKREQVRTGDYVAFEKTFNNRSEYFSYLEDWVQVGNGQDIVILDDTVNK